MKSYIQSQVPQQRWGRGRGRRKGGRERTGGGDETYPSRFMISLCVPSNNVLRYTCGQRGIIKNNCTIKENKQKEITWGWRDDSMVKNTGCSLRGPKLNSLEDSHVGSQLNATLVPGDLNTSSDLYEHNACTWYTDMPAGKTSIYTKCKFLKIQMQLLFIKHPSWKKINKIFYEWKECY